MAEGKRDWSQGFTRPYYKVFPFVKENVGKLGWVALLKLLVVIFQYAINTVLRVAGQLGGYIIAMGITFGAIFLFAIMLAIGLSETAALIVVAFIITLVSLLFLLLLIALMVIIGGMIFGMEIYISRKILDIFGGGAINLDIMKAELKEQWKIYLDKGIRLYLLYTMFLLPILLLPILIVILVILIIILILMLMDVMIAFIFSYVMMYFISFIIIFFLIAAILLINPFIIFITDWTALKMAEGKGAWESFKEAVSYVWRKPKLMKHFWTGYFLITLASSFLTPLAMILSVALPILTKLFLLINDEEYG
ncbi:MAG: hypothetical protein ACMUIG_00980 [Thermoplasmatota archaeon]